MAEPKRKVVRHSAEFKKFTQYLREVRDHSGKTQEEVADAMNLSRSQYANIEGGRSMVNFDHLCSLAKFYKMPLSSFLEGAI